VGETFDGHVTGVAPFGLFVQLDEHFVEGLVHISTLADDDYRFDATARVIYGPAVQQVFKLGQAMRVRIARVDEDRRQIELTVDGVDRPAGRRRGRAPARRRRTADAVAAPPRRRRGRGPAGKRERATRKKSRR
jgi:ribonuclease R